MRSATARPPPTSMTPAFSPGPTRTWRASVGRRARWRREDLYEQCSLHMTAYMASSASLDDRLELVVGEAERPVRRLAAAWTLTHWTSSPTCHVCKSPPATPLISVLQRGPTCVIVVACHPPGSAPR